MNWLPKRLVVVPIDFSDESFQALDTALQLVNDPAHVHAVHVLQELSPVEPGQMWNTVSDEERAQHALAMMRERLAAPQYQGVQIEILFGNPGALIAQHAEKLGADLIVMPSHGRTGFSRLMIGSVAERVVRLAHCPVLVLRGRH